MEVFVFEFRPINCIENGEWGMGVGPYVTL